VFLCEGEREKGDSDSDSVTRSRSKGHCICASGTREGVTTPFEGVWISAVGASPLPGVPTALEGVGGIPGRDWRCSWACMRSSMAKTFCSTVSSRSLRVQGLGLGVESMAKISCSTISSRSLQIQGRGCGIWAVGAGNMAGRRASISIGRTCYRGLDFTSSSRPSAEPSRSAEPAAWSWRQSASKAAS
jgi:hypothetical protein